MKRIILISILLTALFPLLHAQSNTKLGLGYFGHTITHPGIVLEYEWEKQFSEAASLPIRIDAGFYSHPRNHNGVFIDFNYGFRQSFKSGLFLEESIGIGLLGTILNADGVFTVDESGQVAEVSPWNVLDIMPSLTLGIGYNLTKNQEFQTLIWFRPKISWQYPHKTSSTFNPILQIGISRTISHKE